MTAHLHPNHHPCCNTLLRYAAGTLSPAMQMFVATHLTFCLPCRQELQTYESQAGLGLENLPPEELDVSCLDNLLSKIDENGPIACIDVTIPIESTAVYRYPEPLHSVAGIIGERIHWAWRDGYASWELPTHNASHVMLYKISRHQTMHHIAFDHGAILLILNGGFTHLTKQFHRGDIVKSKTALAAITDDETLCLVITPIKSDKPSWWQCLVSFVSGDK